MRLVRERITHREPNGFTPQGVQAWKVIEDKPAVKAVILGDGSSTFEVPILQRPSFGAPQVIVETVTSIVVPDGDFDDEAVFEVNINGNSQLFLELNVVDFGGAITTLSALIEFQDPDFPEFWLPSKEGIDRDGPLTDNIWEVTSTGVYLLSSRVEHKHFKKARFRFFADDAADGDTEIRVNWFHNGGAALVAEQ